MRKTYRTWRQWFFKKYRTAYSITPYEDSWIVYDHAVGGYLTRQYVGGTGNKSFVYRFDAEKKYAKRYQTPEEAKDHILIAMMETAHRWKKKLRNRVIAASREVIKLPPWK